jgi:hypothetical protein
MGKGVKICGIIYRSAAKKKMNGKTMNENKEKDLTERKRNRSHKCRTQGKRRKSKKNK